MAVGGCLGVVLAVGAEARARGDLRAGDRGGDRFAGNDDEEEEEEDEKVEEENVVEVVVALRGLAAPPPAPAGLALVLVGLLARPRRARGAAGRGVLSGVTSSLKQGCEGETGDPQARVPGELPPDRAKALFRCHEEEGDSG